MNQKNDLRKRRGWTPYLLLLPAILSIAVVIGGPLLYSVQLSLTNYNLRRPKDIHFSGLQNFSRMFQDPNIGRVLLNSLIWVVVVVSLQFIFGMILALLLNSRFRLKGIYQSIVFLPWAVSGYLIGLVFRFIFSERSGLFNAVLQGLDLIEAPFAWLGTPGTSMVAPVVAMVWYGIPFFGIMLLAALQSVPLEVIESAKMDAAGPVYIFFKITLPYIWPTVLTTLLLRVVWVFNSSDILYVMTGGGPAYSSSTLPLYGFNQAFSSLDFGYGAAVGLVIMLILIIYTIVYIKLTHFNEAGDF